MELLSHKTLLESISLFHIVKTTGKYEQINSNYFRTTTWNSAS